jgi:pimeloyl-ACP methyl ester carboxylesterase
MKHIALLVNSLLIVCGVKGSMKATFLIGLLAVLIGVSSITSAQNRPVFEKVDCPKGVTATECGYVAVPENRADKTNKTIKVFVAVVRSNLPNKIAEPMMVLAGGPGEIASAGGTVFKQLFPQFDLVLVDQRGIGLSRPALACPEYSQVSAEANATANQAQQALIACGTRLKAQGIDLTAYNATESAADINDIRVALGFDRVVLFGVSYGTRLAQEVMRSYPKGIKAVVLDSVIPAQADRPAESPRWIEESLKKIFEACAVDLSCNSRYPNLEKALNELVVQLNNKPLKVSFAGTTSDLNGDSFLGLVVGSQYFATSIEELPRMVFALAKGNTEILNGSFVEMFTQAVSEGITFGAFFTHECRGEIAFSSIANLRATYALFPRLMSVVGTMPSVSSESGFAVCQAWGLTAPSARENEVVVSDIPTLLMGGEFDPVTPSRLLPLVAAGLKNSTIVEIKGQAHAVWFTPCGFRLMNLFITNPAAKLDTSCSSQGKLNFK